MKKLLISLITVIIWALSLQALAQDDFITGRIDWAYSEPSYDAIIMFAVADAQGWVYVGTQGKLYTIAPGSKEPVMLTLPPNNWGGWYSAKRYGDSVMMSRSIEFIKVQEGGISQRWYQNGPPFTGVFNWCIGPDGTLWGAARRETHDEVGKPIYEYGVLKNTDELMLINRFPVKMSSKLWTKVGPSAVAAATPTHLFIGTLGEVENQSAVRAIYAYNLQTDSLYVAYEGNTNIVYDLEIMEVGTDTILVSGGEFYKIKRDGFLERIGSISATVYDLTQLPGNKLVIGFQGGVMVIDVNQEYLEYIRETQVAPNKADVFGGAQVNSVSYHPESGKTWVGGKNGFLGWFIENDPTKPLKPDKISVVKIGAVSAKLEWPAYPAASNFDHLELLINGDLYQRFTKTEPDSLVLLDFIPDTEYKVELFAINTAGLYSAPADVSFQTCNIASTLQEGGSWVVNFGDNTALVNSIILQPFQPFPPLELTSISVSVESSELISSFEVTREELLINQSGFVEIFLPKSVRAKEFTIQFDLAVSNVSVGFADLEAMPTPEDFALHQNYPNPFNPSTTIKYELPEIAHVTLTIYNLLGQQVAVLVDEPKEAGSYGVLWNGTNDIGQRLSSGVYLYRLRAGSFTQTKKMTLLK